MKSILLQLILVCLLLCGNIFNAFSQSETAGRLYKEGLALFDEKHDYKGAIAKFRQAMRIDPAMATDMQYEIAFAYYYLRQYDSTINILEKLVNRTAEQPNFRHYQLLGNTYDAQGKTEKAMDAYRRGIEQIPDNPNLYQELGVMALNSGDYDKAIEYWNKSMEVAPEYPTSYRRIGQLYETSKNKVKALMYYEIFMNLERGTAFTENASKSLYNIYQENIELKKSKASVKLVQSAVITIDPNNFSAEDLRLPFSSVYELNLTVASITLGKGEGKKNGPDMDQMCTMRRVALEAWYNSRQDTTYNAPLLDWQKKMLDKGYFDAYSHWLLMKGNEKEFEAWRKKHDGEWDNFIAWFSENPMPWTKEDVKAMNKLR